MDKRRKYHKDYYEARKAKGLCVVCGNPSDKLTRCKKCSVRISERRTSLVKFDMEKGAGSICPDCGSSKLHSFEEHILVTEYDQFGRLLIDKKGKLTSELKSPDKARAFDAAEQSPVLAWSVKCLKCGWRSGRYEKKE